MSETNEQELARLLKRKRSMSAMIPVLFVVIPVAMFILGNALGQFQGRLKQRIADMYEAVEKGHAEIYYDEEGVKQWRWLPTTT